MDTKNLKKLRIYIVDDHKLFREGLKLLLSTQDFVHHIYEASNGRDFIENLSFVDCDGVDGYRNARDERDRSYGTGSADQAGFEGDRVVYVRG